MISKIATIVNKYFLLLLVTVMTIAIMIIVSLKPTSKPKDISPLDYTRLEKIQPVLIINPFTLIDKSELKDSMRGLQAMANAATPFKELGIEIFKDQTVNLIINSSGGRVDFGYKLLNFVNFIKYHLKIKTTCYIKEASSMAFTVAISICDKRIALEGIEMMQHPVSVGSKYYTTSTKIDDILISALEASRLGIDPKEWRKISKEQGDKFFTKEEMIKYKLIHEFE